LPSQGKDLALRSNEAAGKFTHRRLRWVTHPDERQCPVK
jgi:hypothetical protein